MSDKLTTTKVREIGVELEDAFYATCQHRTDFQLEALNVKSHETPERQYKQCLDELVRKVSGIGDLEISAEELKDEMEQAAQKAQSLPDGFEQRQADRERRKKKLALWQTEIALEGQLREFKALYAVFKQYPKFTAEQIQAAEAEYYQKRLYKKAALQLESNGRIDPEVVSALTLCGYVADNYANGFAGFLEQQAIKQNKELE